MSDESAPLTVVCETCGVEWSITDQPPACYTRGHSHSLNGIPIVVMLGSPRIF